MARSVRKGQGDPMQALARRIHDLESDNRKRAAEEVRIQPVDEAKPRKNTPERAKQLATDRIASQSSNRVSEVPTPTVARPETLQNNRDINPSRPTFDSRQDNTPSRSTNDWTYMPTEKEERREANERSSDYERNFTEHYQR